MYLAFNDSSNTGLFVNEIVHNLLDLPCFVWPDRYGHDMNSLSCIIIFRYLGIPNTPRTSSIVHPSYSWFVETKNMIEGKSLLKYHYNVNNPFRFSSDFVVV